ncbi:MAG: LpqB family beta-propeller domain-containing protein [Chloroflexi bacterium]|nr:LpqB family beta-propeller domain-containing protein [Chloroflexota bacterium]
MTEVRNIHASVTRYGLGLLAWPSGETGILFSFDGALWLADDATGQIHYMLEANPYPYSDDSLAFGYYAEVAPTGDRIAYTTCAFPQGVPAAGNYSAVGREWGPVSANYDIVVGEIDEDGRYGITRNTRITTTQLRLDHYPVWSPDGSWIASLSMERNPTRGRDLEFVVAQVLDVYRVDGSMGGTDLVRTLGRFDDRAPTSGGIALIPPVWSPDGQYLAYYLVTEKDDGLYTYVLHTTGVDKLPNLSSSAQHRIGTVTATLGAIPPRPSWSPDGQRIAFVVDDGTDRGLFTAQADGTDRRQVARDRGIREVAWSPDGSEILIVPDGPNLVFVSPDGASRRQLSQSKLSPVLGEGFAAIGQVVWSPDGSRIAIHQWDLLVTMDRDGGDPRTLYEGVLRRPAVDPAVCSEGFVVPEPEANPGLVRDCETLLKSVATLAGDSNFRWRADIPITRWAGVIVKTPESEGLPLRVRGLNLERRGLAGSIPPELGDLDGLETLILKSSGLRGSIPPELAKLTNLIYVDISSTGLTGCLPHGLKPWEQWLRGNTLRRCPTASGQ